MNAYKRRAERQESERAIGVALHEVIERLREFDAESRQRILAAVEEYYSRPSGRKVAE